MRKIKVRLGKRSYDIAVCSNEITRLGSVVKKLKIGTDAIVITNSTIKRLFGSKVKKSLESAGFSVNIKIVPDSETAKSETRCIELLNYLSKSDGSRKKLFIVALGGGVVGDLAGFVASIYRRGIPYIQVPTTLLAQVDSAIGGKVAIDLKVGKNLAGSFYQPRLVFSDTGLLRTLGKKDLASGMAEVIKYGIIKSPPLFKFLEKNYKKVLRGDKRSLQYIVGVASAIKANIVAKDEYDGKNVRVILNLGHTIGHAIEAAAQYKKSYSHGQAVALGMIAASRISMQLGLLDKSAYSRIKKLIKNAGLPSVIKGLDTGNIFSAQEHDKKFIHGKNRFVLPVKIGKVVVKEGIPRSLIKDSIASLL
ncbi:MAG: 3-dehydroquinate synthase [Candidatus Omnitrophica bacterium]|nr:3-dehydroquinate synthase [Candidatus Omnitrophota bacterium]MBU4590476.1 3-dehydroquinate synthase [Candidatus Omnitrophota bacterium]